MRELRQNKVKHKLKRGEVATAISGKNNTADIIEQLGDLGFDAA